MARRLAIGSVQLSNRAPRIVAAGGGGEPGGRAPPRGGAPVELRADPCAEARPDAPKLVTHARDLDDLRVLLEVTLVARARGIVTLATGPAGPLSRLLLPAAGSLLTYGHVGRPTAPSGQLPLAELAALLRRLLPPQ